jgi:hypothetical protein
MVAGGIDESCTCKEMYRGQLMNRLLHNITSKESCGYLCCLPNMNNDTSRYGISFIYQNHFEPMYAGSCATLLANDGKEFQSFQDTAFAQLEQLTKEL